MDVKIQTGVQQHVLKKTRTIVIPTAVIGHLPTRLPWTLERSLRVCVQVRLLGTRFSTGSICSLFTWRVRL